MCLIAFAIGVDPGRPLLLAANRDEFFERPTEPLHRWQLPDGTGVVAGRDLRDGGTWLGVSDAGRVAMLTNVRSANPGPGRRSRGELATRWLSAGTDWSSLLAGIDPADYGGFNLVVGDLDTGFWSWISNRDPEHPHADHTATLHHQTLKPGVYGLSNAALDTPWPKTQRLKNALVAALGHREETHQTLARALADDQTSDDDLPSTGVPPDVERALSSPFVDMADRGYGTRSSLVVDVTRSGHGWRAILNEWTHRPAPTGPHRWNDGRPRTLTLG